MMKTFVEFPYLVNEYEHDYEGIVCIDIMQVSSIGKVYEMRKEVSGQCIIRMNSGKVFRLLLGYDEMKEFIKKEFGGDDKPKAESIFTCYKEVKE